ncbi:tetratricopeptide repeat protein [Pelomyxa schiedti]|nr:tetratricopeptide repeat protein [Pelomyxa schiedti]
MAATKRHADDSNSSYVGSLVEQANAGNAKAMRDLARCYHYGTRGVAKCLDRASDWYRAARDGGGLCFVGREYYNDGAAGTSRRHVDKAVSAWTTAAVEFGDHWAMVCLAWCYSRGVGVERDLPRAVALYEGAISGGSKAHSWWLGACYLRGDGVERDWGRAAGLMQRAGDDGDAQAYLGWCYLWGDGGGGGGGVERDVAKAVKLLSSAASVFVSSARARVFLGYCYQMGIGVERDAKWAGELFNKAKGSAPWDAAALGELGEFCQRGDCGAPTDKRAAAGYFQMGADGGDPVSMFHLGVCLRDGDGVDCDPERSHHWLVKAAELRHRGAAKILSSLSIEGKNKSAQQQDIVGSLETILKEQELPAGVAHSEEGRKKSESIQGQIVAENLRKHLTEEEEHKTIVNKMISLMSATVGDFSVEKLIGTGSNASAVFQVQYQATRTTMSVTSCMNASACSETKTEMVMKIIFNWENTPHVRKYMAECVVLSLVPNHPNVIHALGALIIPCLPAEFVEKLPSGNKESLRELCNKQSLAILMPHCGVTLSSFILSSSRNHTTAQVVQNLLVQALKAICHIESHFVVHRDIKGDSILVDPETGKLTLIDFGEAQHCPNMEMMVSATAQAWGNTGTIPPELSMFLQRMTTIDASGVFSYSKCDSFALALTFYNALLPPDHKFIGHHHMNRDMTSAQLSAELQAQPTPTATKRLRHSNSRSTITEQPLLLESVMIGMMIPEKAARLCAAGAIEALTS